MKNTNSATTIISNRTLVKILLSAMIFLILLVDLIQYGLEPLTDYRASLEFSLAEHYFARDFFLAVICWVLIWKRFTGANAGSVGNP